MLTMPTPGISSVLGGSGKDDKINDLAADTKSYHEKDNRITTDWGLKQTNTDDWLKVVNEGKTGPMLLEDSAGREKVYCLDLTNRHC
jgi:catalase